MARKSFPLQVSADTKSDGGTGELKAGPRPAWLSDTEALLYEELITTTRKLAELGVPVSYSVIAEVAEAMQRAHREGRSALPAIADGLDTMRSVECSYRASIVAHRREVFGEEGNAAMCVFAVIAALLATGATLAGFGSGTPW